MLAAGVQILFVCRNSLQPDKIPDSVARLLSCNKETVVSESQTVHSHEQQAAEPVMLLGSQQGP